MAVSISTVISGYLLRATGFVEGADQQSEVTLYWIRFCEITLPSILCLVSVVILTKYPLTEDRAYEVKELLAKRKEAESHDPAPED